MTTDETQRQDHVLKNWRDYAVCQEIPFEMFFSDCGQGETKKIIKICEGCPVRRWCLSAALKEESRETRFRYGIRGGLTPIERKRLWESLLDQRTVDMCHQGLHEMTEENSFYSPQGHRDCRLCRRDRQARSRLRAKVG